MTEPENITDGNIEKALADDPTQHTTQSGSKISEGWNLKMSAYCEAHGGQPTFENYDYVDADAIVEKVKRGMMKGMIGDFGEMCNRALKPYYEQGYFRCMVCGSGIKHHYFCRFPDGTYGPLGSECVDVATGETIGATAQVAAQKAIRDTVDRRRVRAATKMLREWVDDVPEAERSVMHHVTMYHRKVCPYKTEAAEELNRKEWEEWRSGLWSSAN